MIGSRAYREWANSVRLAKLGIAQPETITVATRLAGLGVSGSFLVTREVPAAVSLEDLLNDPDNPPDDALLERLADKLAEMIRRMHGGGLCHWDLKLRNVIVSRRPDGQLVLVPIDAVNGRSIRPWNRRHCIRRDYRFLLRHPCMGPLIAARRQH
jgi:tRNA A-37 threonylcarbamoyl transferase component Bud32